MVTLFRPFWNLPDEPVGISDRLQILPAPHLRKYVVYAPLCLCEMSDTNTRFSSFVDLRQIASRYVLTKAKVIGLIGMRRNNTDQITKAVTVAQLPEHHDEQLVPACEMLHVFVPFVFHYNSIKNSLWQELYELSKDIFSGVHRMTDLLLDCKSSQFKSSPSIFCSKTLYLSNLQTSPLFFSGH